MEATCLYQVPRSEAGQSGQISLCSSHQVNRGRDTWNMTPEITWDVTRHQVVNVATVAKLVYICLTGWITNYVCETARDGAIYMTLLVPRHSGWSTQKGVLAIQGLGA